jgi:MFS family permease
MTDAAVELDAPAASSNRAPIFALLLAGIISNLGNAITSLAIPWFVLETTGSAARTGLVGAATFLPMVIASIFGGALVDRVSRKRLSIAADLLSCGTVALIPTLYYTVGLNFTVLLAIVFLGAILDTPGASARNAMIPSLSRTAGMSLERTNSFNFSASSAASLLGPTIAGLLIAWLGPKNVLYIDAASFAISALMFAIWVPNLRVPREDKGSYAEDVRAGYAFLRRQRLILTIVVTGAVMNFLAAPFGSVLLPVWIYDHGWTARDLGFLFSGFGGGQLVGALLFTVLAKHFKRRTLLISFFIAIGLPLALFGIVDSLPVGIALGFLAGSAIGSIGPLLATVMQKRIPDDMRGRVSGTAGAISMSIIPLGLLITGPLVQWFGVNAVLLAFGAILGLLGASLLLQPVMHELDLPAEEQSATGTTS